MVCVCVCACVRACVECDGTGAPVVCGVGVHSRSHWSSSLSRSDEPPRVQEEYHWLHGLDLDTKQRLVCPLAPLPHLPYPRTRYASDEAVWRCGCPHVAQQAVHT
eukprot:3941823-Rhodomonas_salina.5